MKHYVIFTDLDATLLDEDSYSFKDAENAIKALKHLNIPVILCSSKTKAEMEVYRKKMGLESFPFISENGAAVFIPKSSRLKIKRDSILKESADYFVYELGIPRKKILDILNELSKRFKFKGFNDMSTKEISEITGLSLEEASLAQQRDYSEPILFLDSERKLEEFSKLLKEKGLNIKLGGRFYNISGNNNKGKAVNILKELYKSSYPEKDLIFIALGDSPNDLEMLENVDKPVVIKRKDGSHRIKIEGAYYTNFIGPKGWQEAILTLIPEVKLVG